MYEMSNDTKPERRASPGLDALTVRFKAGPSDTTSTLNRHDCD